MAKGDKNSWYIKLLSLFKLETTTMHGRTNLAGVVILAIFCLLYVASDAIRHLISAVEDVAKSYVLQSDIYHEYKSASVVEAVIPIVIAFALCLLFLAWHEYRKK